MGTVDSDNKREQDLEVPAGVGSGVGDGGKDLLVVQVGQDGPGGSGGLPPGTSRYVFAAFFAVGLALTYVLGHTVSSAWSKLASTQRVVDVAPWITQAGEDSRQTWGHVVGGVIALAALVYAYRRKDIRTWVHEAASELAKVTWPTKDEVIQGTVVVMVAAFISTVYLTLLDRFWGFVTDLVYRA